LKAQVILNKHLIKQTLEANRETLRKYGVKRIGLFGSYVKGPTHADSDIDLLVEFEALSFDHYMGLRIFLEDLFEKKIDLVIANSIRPRLRPRIEKEVEHVNM
jgi:predicted nucleotidyltransferase